ncbi:hypothetical protein RKD55_000775 [Rossellomorea marisflavi]
MSIRHRPLKKIVFGMTEETIGKVIANHEARGWRQSTPIKKHGYGLGCQMIWQKK